MLDSLSPRHLQHAGLERLAFSEGDEGADNSRGPGSLLSMAVCGNFEKPRKYLSALPHEWHPSEQVYKGIHKGAKLVMPARHVGLFVSKDR